MAKKAVTIESAVPLSASQVREIAGALSAGEAEVKTKVVPGLIAGLRVHIGGKMIDLSLKSKLQQLEEHLGNNE